MRISQFKISKFKGTGYKRKLKSHDHNEKEYIPQY